MFVDVRIYTLPPGALPAYVARYAKEGYPVQQKHGMNCLGYYIAEVGVLNRTIHLWGYDTVAEREEKRGNLGKDPAWQAYLAGNRDALQHQENKIMVSAPFYPMKNPNPGPIGVVDFRTYYVKHGRLAEFVKLYAEEGMPIQLGHLGHNLGWFISHIGPQNQVVLLWAYPSVEERAKRRAAMTADPAWQAYGKKSSALLVHMENTLVTPAPFITPKG
jgi:hypothetical protein